MSCVLVSLLHHLYHITITEMIHSSRTLRQDDLNVLDALAEINFLSTLVILAQCVSSW